MKQPRFGGVFYWGKRMAVSDWSENPAANTTIDTISIAEGCSPGNLNDACRAIMAAVKTFSTTVQTAGTSQPLDATLTALAAVTTAANKLIYATGSDTFATTDLSAFARTILDDADAAAVRTTIGALGALSSSSLVENGGYIVHANGLKETWGYVDVGANGYGSYSLPVAHSSWVLPVTSASVGAGNSSQSENAGVYNVTTSTISLYNAENFSVRIYIHTKGV